VNNDIILLLLTYIKQQMLYTESNSGRQLCTQFGPVQTARGTVST